MPILSIRHATTYTYANPVALGEHRMMFRPRDGHDLNILNSSLEITPEPVELRWLHDVFGNSVALAKFSGRTRRLHFESMLTLEHLPITGLLFSVDDGARRYPFAYEEDELPDLLPSIERQYSDPEGQLNRWARRFLDAEGGAETVDMLAAMTHAIKREFAYIRRERMGVQEPLQTLALGTGSCRDFAVLMIEAVRCLGLAARFVSGYLYVPDSDREGHVGGGATHAWVRVYLPGAGWVEFDPTNGIVGNRNLIRVAVTRHPQQAVPLSGTWIGFPTDSLGMTVEVSVTDALAASHQRQKMR
ncbi:MAG TPA: transglutaminase family protein [Stellaceae bacterium]|nr:transglutaminase family protein [Stellaceae bacterium]